ncbi:MAG: PEP/pyruvate-binding domain-containing protein [Desulfatirhabdiaceae bacterium]
MQIKSKALEVNIASYAVDVTINSRYQPLQEIMSRYYGLLDGLNAFLKEVSHPYRNWQFIVQEARSYSLDYFYMLQKHELGPKGAGLFIDIFLEAIDSGAPDDVCSDAVDNLMLFLQKIIRDSKSDISRFIPVLNDTFAAITHQPDDRFFRFVKSYFQIKRLAEAYLRAVPEDSASYSAINALLIRCCQTTFAYWLSLDDPKTWFEQEVETSKPVFDTLFADISHQRMTEWNQELAEMTSGLPSDSKALLLRLLELPAFSHMVDVYKQIPMSLWKAGENITQANQWKVIFLFHIMNITALSLVHEDTLREINRTLTWLISNESHRNISRLIQKTFSILKTRTVLYPQTALNCVLTMGKGVYKTDESDLVNFFIESVISLNFQFPQIGGVGNDWQIQANSAHIQNIRAWLELIELNPKWSTRLLSCLIIYLALGGVFIKDTDLFPRDITRFLNSDIEPVYNLAKQLMRMFPSFFNDIGAEGELRDISTQLDEMTRRKDSLIHFLRKQSHVESSNQIVGFIEAVISFWITRDKSILKSYLPPSIDDQIQTTGPHIDGVNEVMGWLYARGMTRPEDYLKVGGEDILRLCQEIQEANGIDIERVRLLAKFYQLLHNKYNPDITEIHHYIDQLKVNAFPGLDQLKDALAEPHIRKKTGRLLDFLETLKNLILSRNTFEVREDIYKKRHFTVDIPSMYGSYHELKFDALGLAFRVEAIVNILFEDLIGQIDLSLITKSTIHQLHDLIKLFEQALKLDGIQSVELERQLDFLDQSLEIRGFTFTQYLDVFKGFAQAVKNIVNDYFNNVHEENLSQILKDISPSCIQKRFLSPEESEDREKRMHRISEIFFRDRIVFSPGLQQLDRFLTQILNVLYHQSEKLHRDQLRQLLLYDPYRAIATLNGDLSRTPGIIHIGNKGINMVKLKQYGLPVPPGFIITTEVFRCQEIIDNYAPARKNFQEQVCRHIRKMEKKTGKIFGHPGNPLLFSVRSGASISQPGMMDTLLNVGMNETIAEGLAFITKNPWFAWDNYRRFLQCYGMAIGFERDHFDAIIADVKKVLGVPLKRYFSGDQMRRVAMAYRQSILDSGQPVVDDPMEQLHMTIRSVFRSWESPKARTYRQIMGISDDWGTAVTIQSMVFGNLNRQSGTGVIFTHNPRWSGDRIRLWGDFTIGNQGEDVVSGLVTTLPISIFQQEIETRDTDITLETHFPEIFMALEDMAHMLIEKKGWTPQEMEFTFESPSVRDLYVLQTRDMAMRERKRAYTFELDDLNASPFLGHGIGVSGGAMSGRIIFSLEDVEQFRGQHPADSLILVRGDTVPDDIREIFAADGLLTARGGLTSHAAVVAHRLGKTCVVGCSNLVCSEKDKRCYFQDLTLSSGDFISIDGQEGSVYQGKIAIQVP